MRRVWMATAKLLSSSAWGRVGTHEFIGPPTASSLPHFRDLFSAWVKSITVILCNTCPFTWNSFIPRTWLSIYSVFLHSCLSKYKLITHQDSPVKRRKSSSQIINFFTEREFAGLFHTVPRHSLNRPYQCFLHISPTLHSQRHYKNSRAYCGFLTGLSAASFLLSSIYSTHWWCYTFF